MALRIEGLPSNWLSDLYDASRADPDRNSANLPRVSISTEPTRAKWLQKGNLGEVSSATIYSVGSRKAQRR
jgi:hypothetical protein